MNTKLTKIDFFKAYSDSSACYAYLCQQKWSKGFTCRRCDHSISVKGRTHFHRRCQSCGYDESPTAHTLFHKLKFPIEKAFAIIYELSTLKKGMSTCEISRQYGIHQETAWYFKRKVQQAMGSHTDKCLTSFIEVDEVIIGGAGQSKQGRNKGQKKIVLMGLEMEYPEEDEDRPIMKRTNMTLLNNYSAQELKRGINKIADEDAVVCSDQWTSYPKAVGQRMHVSFPSDAGANFQHLHWHIFNLKNWIRGIHHKISEGHAQRYLDEFSFRFNSRNFSKSNPFQIIKTMCKLPWMPYSSAIAA